MGSFGAAVAMSAKARSAGPSQPATPVNFAVPADACDCHTHIHGDPRRFPFFVGRVDTLDRVGRRGWHVQLNTNLAMIAALRVLVAATRVPIVFDHFGGAQAALGTGQPGFDTLVDLVRSGRAYVKISGAYRSSSARRTTPTLPPSPRPSLAPIRIASSGVPTGRTPIRRRGGRPPR
jgi:hypothetical protein